MGKKSGPKAPDPQATAQAQAQANREAILDSALVNRTNVVSPFGSVSWTDATGNPINPNQNYTPAQMAGWTQTTTLGPSEQALKDALDSQALTAAGQLPQGSLDLSGLPAVAGYKPGRYFEVPSFDLSGVPEVEQMGRYGDTPTLSLGNAPSGIDLAGLRDVDRNYSQDAQRVEQATYDRLVNLMSPELDDRRRRLENRLAVMGHAPGGEGFGLESDRLNRIENEALTNAALESVGAGRAEQSRLFGIDKAIRDQQLQERMGQYGTQLSSAQLEALNRQAEFGAGMQGRQQRVAEDLARANLGLQTRGQGLQEALSQFNTGMSLRQQDERENLNQIAASQNRYDRLLRETMMERQNPYNELAAILQGSPAIGMPAAPAPAQYQMAPSDITGLINNQFAVDSANQQAKKSGLTNLGSTGLMALALSDKRLKDKIVKIGRIGVHDLFEWTWKPNKFGLAGKAQGVVAQLVQTVSPRAVYERDGFLAVDYGALTC